MLRLSLRESCNDGRAIAEHPDHRESADRLGQTILTFMAGHTGYNTVEQATADHLRLTQQLTRHAERDTRDTARQRQAVEAQRILNG